MVSLLNLTVLVSFCVSLGCATISWEDIEDFSAIQKILSKPRKLDREKLHLTQENSVLPDKPVNSFSWKSCGQQSDPTTINDISISPDPITLPGNLTIGVDAKLNVPLTAPISLDLSIKKKVVFWIPIPCVDNVGSCNYEDVCQLLPQLNCPAPFKKYGIPCACPIKAGTYKLPPTPFFVNPVGIPSWLESGDYQATAKLSMGSQEIACIEVELSIQN